MSSWSEWYTTKDEALARRWYKEEHDPNDPASADDNVKAKCEGECGGTFMWGAWRQHICVSCKNWTKRQGHLFK